MGSLLIFSVHLTLHSLCLSKIFFPHHGSTFTIVTHFTEALLSLCSYGSPAPHQICTKCVCCKSCGATKPGKSWDAQWSHDFSMCHDCAKLFSKGEGGQSAGHKLSTSAFSYTNGVDLKDMNDFSQCKVSDYNTFW